MASGKRSKPDIATYAKRLVRFVDGRITHDGNVSGETITEMAT